MPCAKPELLLSTLIAHIACSLALKVFIHKSKTKSIKSRETEADRDAEASASCFH
jgi:hypothetical protein